MDPITPIIVGLGLWLFAPQPKLFQPKPDMKAVAAAQVEADRAKEALSQTEAAREKVEAELERLRTQLQIKDKEERTKERQVLGYSLEMTEMATDSLQLVPEEHRTPEVLFAAECLAKSGGALSSVLGPLTQEQRLAVLQLVKGALSKAVEEREAARKLIAEKDRLLTANTTSLLLLQKEKEQLVSVVEEKKAEVGVVKAEVLMAKAESSAKDTELRNVNETQLRLMSGHRETLFYVVFWGVFAWLWFTRFLPALAKTFVWAKCLERFNQLVFRCLLGSSNLKD